jgi:hypothetical protein
MMEGRAVIEVIECGPCNGCERWMCLQRACITPGEWYTHVTLLCRRQFRHAPPPTVIPDHLQPHPHTATSPPPRPRDKKPIDAAADISCRLPAGGGGHCGLKADAGGTPSPLPCSQAALELCACCAMYDGGGGRVCVRAAGDGCASTSVRWCSQAHTHNCRPCHPHEQTVQCSQLLYTTSIDRGSQHTSAMHKLAVTARP